MKFRYMVLAAAYGLLFAVNCHFSNYPILDMRRVQYLTETDILMSLHDSVSGYHGLQQLLVAYTLPFLLGSYYVSDKQAFFRVARYGTRREYKRAEVKKMVWTAALFMVIHQMIDFLYTAVNFKRSFLEQYPFGLYTAAAGVIAALFYIQTGLIYQIIQDWLKRDLAALLLTFGLNYAQHILIKYKYALVGGWIPGRDLFAAFDFFSGACDFSVVLFTIAKSLLMIILLYLASQSVFEKKDIIKYEK